MTFGNLATMDLGEFIEQNRLVDELCVFIHIPKTAGSSFSAELRNQRSPYHNIHVQYAAGARTSRIQDVLADFAANPELAEARSCSGHFTYSHAKILRTARPDARFISFLRNPIKRVISDYRYARTPVHPTYQSFIDKYPDITSYVNAAESQNKMARFILPSLDMNMAEIESHIDSKFLFIGLLEMYPFSFNVVSRLLGKNAMPSEHRRKTTETKDNVVQENDELYELIKSMNKKDHLLYNLVRKRLVAARESWRELKNSDRPRMKEARVDA